MKIILPLSVTIPRKTKADKVFTLNLNIYRNCHHFVLNQAKIAWKAIVEQSMPKNMIVECSPFKFTYTVFPASGRKFDLANVLSIVQKFTDDALVEYGVIPDDSYKIIPIIVYKFGAVDKENPRVELDIQSLRCDFDNLPF
jgi:Holliday junction resolvase RusA-like endonuclease